MTTQSIKCIAANKTMARALSDTSTDGTFQTNLLLSDLSNTNLGLEMPNEVITDIQMTYTAGCGIWRIQDSNSLATERYGFCSPYGKVNASESAITPFRVKPTSLLQCYPRAVNAASNDTEVIGWVVTSSGPEPFGCSTTADNTDTAMTSVISGLTLGDYAFNTVLQRITLQAEDGATNLSISIKDQTGGTQFQSKGAPRAQAGSISNYFNIDIPVSIKIQKGWQLYCAVTSA